MACEKNLPRCWRMCHKQAMRKLAIFLIPFLCCLLLGIGLPLPGTGLASEGKKEAKKEQKAEKKPEKKEEKKTEKKEAAKGEKKEEAPKEAFKPPPLDTLWDDAQDKLSLGDTEGAARVFYQVHFYYPDDQKGEPALWQAANLQKELAQGAKDADWDKVLERFRRYISYYPKSEHVAEAYFELAKTYQAMRYHREALTYLKLFMTRYPDSPLVVPAMRWYRNSLLRSGSGAEAEKVFKGWQKSANATVRLLGEAGLGNLKSLKGDHQAALDIYQKIMAATPDFQVADPDLLRHAGIANLRLKKTELGREQLYHYLTLVGMVSERPEVMLELAESYLATEEHLAAQKLYRQIMTEGGNERAVLLSRLRQAQDLDNPEIGVAKWQRHNDLKDAEGDKPYLAVLEKLYRDPIAQDARYGIFKRYQARGELGKAYDMGRNFLRAAQPEGASPAQGKQVGQILLYLVEGLLKEKKYQQIYDLYSDEHRHIKDYPDGRLHAMVGQALEAMSLFEPAAALYYQAMQLPMSDQEKTDLYFRRARVYLAMQDYDALDRLLTYLRKTYQGKPEAEEIAYYSAKLSAARGQIDKANEFYGQVLSHAATPEDSKQTAEEALSLLVKEAKFEQAEAMLAKAVAGKALSPAAEQGWWLRLANGWREKSDLSRAAAAYRNGLGQGMPDTGEAVQEIHLYLGDVLFAQGEQKEGLSHYQIASQGEHPLWKQLATERLTQNYLDTEMAAMKKGVKK